MIKQKTNKITCIVFTEKQLQVIDKLAEQNERSRSYVVRGFVNEYIQKNNGGLVV